jgi:hypothetical protein
LLPIEGLFYASMGGTRTRSLAVVLLVGATLTACTPEAPEVPLPTPSDEPSSSATPEVASDLLFTITATVTAPSGASLALQQQVFTPVDFAQLPAELQSAYTADCLENPVALPDYIFVRAEVDATDSSPAGLAWPAGFDTGYDLALVRLGDLSKFTGAVSSSQMPCATPRVHPGHSEGAVAVIRTASPTDVGGWARLVYGFSSGWDVPIDEVADKIPVYSDCTITMGPAAGTTRLDPSTTRLDPYGCIFGDLEYFTAP